jgi:hypothetical protein
MAKPSYRYVNVDLTLGVQQQEQGAQNQKIASIWFAQVPTGAVAFYQWGTGGDLVPIMQNGVWIADDECDYADAGLFITADAQPGVSIGIYIEYSGGASGVGIAP